MNLQKRIELIDKLREYLLKNEPDWQQAIMTATEKNQWFTKEFIQLATQHIIEHFLQKNKVMQWALHYHLDDLIVSKRIGIIMAGNIPMVGFHDFLCVFICGHYQTIKLSSKDDILLKHLIGKMHEWDLDTQKFITVTTDLLIGCDAYIATGGNQSASIFEDYFGKYPHIIRKNKTSVAVLTGNETMEELQLLSKDIHTYFGLGCRNVTKLYVPAAYDFIPLLHSFNEFKYFRDYNKYGNNYDYQLSICLLNNIRYMTNESTLLIENKNLFSPIGMVHYETYENRQMLINNITNNPDIQCIIGKGFTPFGKSQEPDLFTYADGIDIMPFLLSL